MFSYNIYTSVQESTGYSPYELIFEKIPRAYPSLEEEIDVTYRQYLTNLFNNNKNTRHSKGCEEISYPF